MLSFRQKILLANLIVVTIILALLLPIANTSVKRIVFNALEERATEIIAKIDPAKNFAEMLKLLKEEKAQLFFRVSILNDKGGVLYDTHTRKILMSSFIHGYIAYHPEVEQALIRGVGYSEGHSTILQQDMTYVAKRFSSHGKVFVIRTAFPYKHVTALSVYVVSGFFLLGIAILLLFSLMTWFIIHHFTDPIQQIVQAIKPYQVGEKEFIPEIQLDSATPTDEFFWLADTLNSLSRRVQNQIATLTQERNEKEAVLESLDEGVIAVNDKMLVTYANNMALKMLNLQKEDFLHHNFSVANKPEFQNLLIACQHKEQIFKTTATLGKRPKRYHLFVIAAPKGKEKGAILVLQDKSSHYRMLEMRKDFVANASHELKTPITIIQGFAETLHDNPDLVPKISSEITQKIVYNCQRMTNIITDLLTLADIENLPHSRLLRCDLSQIIERCQYTTLSVYPDAIIKIHVSTSNTFLIADPNLLEVAIQNLLDNAAKYSPSPAKIDITLERESKYLKIIIVDQGIGIAKGELDNIFQRFYKISKTKTSKIKSSGLGLSIVETIIEKHFGKISATSTLGEGTTFTILLPTKLLSTKDYNL